jgi:hypothetical protein
VRSKSSNLADFDRLGEMSFSEFAANTLRDRNLFHSLHQDHSSARAEPKFSYLCISPI